jgi:hypothetical protein
MRTLHVEQQVVCFEVPIHAPQTKNVLADVDREQSDQSKAV